MFYSTHLSTVSAMEFCCCLAVESCLTLCDSMACSLPGSSVHGIFQGMDCHALLQGIFPTQGLNPSLLLPVRFLTAELPGKPLPWKTPL